MIHGGFLSKEDRGELIALARDGSAACRVTRRANALVLLDDGWELSAGRPCVFARRRHGPRLAQAFRTTRDRRPDQLRCWRKHQLSERQARRRFESVGWCDLATLDAQSRRLDRTGIRSRLRKPLGTDRALAIVLGSNITSRKSSRASSTKRSRRCSSRATISS